MSEESKKGIYDQSSFDGIKPRLNDTKPKYPATPLENWNDAPGRRDAQFENHCSKCLWNVVYRLETLKILVPALHKIAISRKTKSFSIFCLSILDSMDPWHYLSIYSKKLLTNQVYKF